MSEAAPISTLPTWHNRYPQAPADRLPPLGWPLALTTRHRLRDARRLAKQALALAQGQPSGRARTGSAASLAHAFRALGLSPDDPLSARTMEVAAAIAGGALVEVDGKPLRRSAAWIAALSAALDDPGLHLCVATEHDVEEAAATLADAAARLGITLGCVRAGDTADARRRAYGAPLTLVSVDQLAGDYLRDYLQLGPKRSPISLKLDHLRTGRDRALPLLRGLKRVVLAEAGTILLDRARQPVMLTGPTQARLSRDVIADCIGLARQLRPEADFRVTSQGISMTEAGRARLSRLAHLYPGPAPDTALGEKRLHRGLMAVHGLVPERDYAVTGTQIRPATHPGAPPAELVTAAIPFLEVLHDLPPTEEDAIAARVNLQRLFSRYVTLSGAGLGLVAVGREIRRIYRAPTPLSMRQRGDRPGSKHVATDETTIAAALCRGAEQARARGRTLTLITPDRKSAEAARHHLPDDSLVLWPGANCPVPPADRHHILLTTPLPEAGLRHMVEGIPGLSPSQVTVLIDLRTAPVPDWWRRMLHRIGNLPLGHHVLRAQASFTIWSMTRRASRIRRELWDYDQRLSDMLAFAGETE